MREWRQCQLANGRKWRRGSASSVPKFPAESQPQCGALQTHQSATCRSPTKAFECLGVVVTAAVTDVTARIESAIRVVQRKGSRKSGDKRSSRSGRVREISSNLSRAATAKKKKEGRKRETWRRWNSGVVGVAPFSSGERRAREKKSIPTSSAPGGGARYMYHTKGADSLYSDAQGRKR